MEKKPNPGVLGSPPVAKLRTQFDVLLRSQPYHKLSRIIMPQLLGSRKVTNHDFSKTWLAVWVSIVLSLVVAISSGIGGLHAQQVAVDKEKQVAERENRERADLAEKESKRLVSGYLLKIQGALKETRGIYDDLQKNYLELERGNVEAAVTPTATPEPTGTLRARVEPTVAAPSPVETLVPSPAAPPVAVSLDPDGSDVNVVRNEARKRISRIPNLPDGTRGSPYQADNWAIQTPWDWLKGLGQLAEGTNLAAKTGKAVEEASGALKDTNALTKAKKPLGETSDTLKSDSPPVGGKVRAVTPKDPWVRKDLDPKWLDPDGNVIWPPNNGAAGPETVQQLKPGTIIDRFGSENGHFTSPKGTSYEQRSMPYEKLALPYSQYEVLKPLNANTSQIAPWFDQSGGGTQFRFDRTVKDLIANGYLRKVN
jgi:hypothetical protein